MEIKEIGCRKFSQYEAYNFLLMSALQYHLFDTFSIKGQKST